MPPKRTYTFQIDTYIGYPITAQWVKQQLQACGDRPVTVLINSIGGDLATALTIRQQFIDHGNVTVHFTGFSASAATILAMGAKHISMSRHALILVHQCLGYSEKWGYFNRDKLQQAIADLKKKAADLDTIDRVVASIYADRAGAKPQDMAALMAEDRWLTADQALELGLIDAIDEEEQDPSAAPQKLTATARAHFAACGLPLPNSQSDDTPEPHNQPQPHWLATLIQSLRDLLHPQTPTNTTTTNTTDMEQTTITAPHLCEALHLESIQATGQSITLTPEQLTTIESTIQAIKQATAKAQADREEAIRARDEATAKAQAAQEAKAKAEEAKAKAEATLAASDGADTEQATPTPSQDSPIQAGITAANFYAQFGTAM